MNEQTQMIVLPVGAEGELISASAGLLSSKAGVEGHMTFFGPLQIMYFTTTWQNVQNVS